MIYINQGVIMLKNILLLLAITLLLNACASTENQIDKVEVSAKYINEKDTVELFQLVAVDGKSFTKKSVAIGPHTFYIQGLKTLPSKEKAVLHSMHSIKVKLEKGAIYHIMSKIEKD